jgi:hypothetical protein
MKGSAAKGSAAKAKTPMALAPSPFVFAQLPTPESLGAFPAGGRAGGRAPEAADLLDVIGSVRAPPSARARYAAEMHAAVVTGVAEAAAAFATDAEAAAITEAPATALRSLSTEDVAAMKVKELREALETLGLDTSGKRAELATRLVGALGAAKAPAPAPVVEATEVVAEAAPLAEAVPEAEAAPAAAPSAEALQAAADAVAAMKVAELRESLASRGLDTGGKRVALAERLLAALVAEAVAAPAEEEPIEWLTSGHEWIGKQVLRNLDGIEIHARVTKWAPAEGSDPALWHVVHDDQDEEDLDETDMLAALEAFEQRAGQRKGTSLKHKGTKATSSHEASLNRGKRAAAAEPAPAPADEVVPASVNASVKRSKSATTAPDPAPAPAPEEAPLAEAPASAARPKRGAKRGVEPAPEPAPEPASSARSSRARR